MQIPVRRYPFEAKYQGVLSPWAQIPGRSYNLGVEIPGRRYPLRARYCDGVLLGAEYQNGVISFRSFARAALSSMGEVPGRRYPLQIKYQGGGSPVRAKVPRQRYAIKKKKPQIGVTPYRRIPGRRLPLWSKIPGWRYPYRARFHGGVIL